RRRKVGLAFALDDAREVPLAAKHAVLVDQDALGGALGAPRVRDRLADAAAERRQLVVGDATRMHCPTVACTAFGAVGGSHFSSAPRQYCLGVVLTRPWRKQRQP